ncbi:Uncharacterised protein [Legionella beliardensis]|uniref:Transmembrane protein n=1 Tax=Legionella beliardensis TaxID=91822 RepID=A0A378I2D7_9GAMM|nr:hypothetical protein [Legionella beliardensis]STX28816.1 Uncharacterised protein [Legionella beliardensis]
MAHNSIKWISLVLLGLFTLAVVAILFVSGGGLGFALAPMVCDNPASCQGMFSILAVWMLVLFPVQLILSLLIGWVCFFLQKYKQAMWLTWGVSMLWLVFIFVSL